MRSCQRKAREAVERAVSGAWRAIGCAGNQEREGGARWEGAFYVKPCDFQSVSELDRRALGERQAEDMDSGFVSDVCGQ